MEKVESPIIGNPRRKYLTMAISSLLIESGFENCDKDCIETLTEMLQSLIVEIGESSRNYCELSGRTQPIIGDVVVSLINMGLPIQGIEAYAKRECKFVIPQPQQMTVQKQLNLLQAGIKNSHPAHIPNHLPPLPDPHAYIRTPTYKQPVTEYEAIREKSANQKRDIERALTKFLAKTSDTHSLFDTEDNQMFPLIACKPAFPSYLAALNPTDQVFDFEELEYHYQVANRTEDCTTKDNDSGNEDENNEDMNKDKENSKNEEAVANATATAITTTNSSTAGSTTLTNIMSGNDVNNQSNIDNPYLRAATIPKKG